MEDLLDNGTPSITGLEHFDSRIGVLDASLKILAAAEASDEEDALYMVSVN